MVDNSKLNLLSFKPTIRALPSRYCATQVVGAKKSQSIANYNRDFNGIYGSYVKTAISLTILLIEYERKSVNIPDSLSITVDETDIINRMLTQPEILDSAKFAHSSSQSKKILTERLLGFTHYLFHQYFPQEAAEFFEKFERAENLSANSPILLVRNYLIDDKIQPNVLKLTKKRKLELVFACFKAFVF